MEIKTNRLVLRDLQQPDIAVLPSLIDDLEISRYLAVVPYPYSAKDAEWFVEHCIVEARKQPRENYELGITLQSTGELVGVVGLTKVSNWDKKATLGYWLGKEFWRNGYMYEAVQGLLAYAFTDLDLQRIDVAAAIQNDASNGLIRKIGAKLEGTSRRDHRTKSTKEFVDTFRYGLLKEDWKP